MPSISPRLFAVFVIGSAVAFALPPALDLPSIDRTLSEAAQHAANYPPRFSSPAERTAIEGRLRTVIQTLDTAVAAHPDDTNLLLRDGFANALGTNLDFPHSPAQCTSAYLLALKREPNNPAANFQYGAFLGSTNHPQESISYLRKAAALGVSQAHWALAISLLLQQDKTGAIAELKTYLSLQPNDPNAKALLAHLEDPNLKIQTSGSGSTR